jgi:hypothetical protein
MEIHTKQETPRSPDVVCVKRASGQTPLMLKLTRPDTSFGVPLARVGLTTLKEGGKKLRFDIEDCWCEIEGVNLHVVEALLHRGLLAEIICPQPIYSKADPRPKDPNHVLVFSIRFYKYIKKEIQEIYLEK